MEVALLLVLRDTEMHGIATVTTLLLPNEVSRMRLYG